jgi:metal-dependent amidase/aminoacylase/carboxypeptidase family protein
VLPESVELEGTLRTHSSEVQQRVKARVSEIGRFRQRLWRAD